jgi:hypothetical protein
MGISAFLETVDRDLALSDGSLVLIRAETDARVITQRIENRFRFFLGEWFLDTREGVPYFQEVLIKNPDIEVLKRLFSNVIATTPGVAEVTDIVMSYEPSTRTLSYAWAAETDTGVLVSGTNAFVVTGQEK